MYIGSRQSLVRARRGLGMGGTITIQTTALGAGGQNVTIYRTINDTDAIPTGWTASAVNTQTQTGTGTTGTTGTTALSCTAPLVLSADGLSCVTPPAPASTSSISDFFSNLFAPGSALLSNPVASIPIPMWGWIAGGVAAFYLLSGSSRAPARGRR